MVGWLGPPNRPRRPTTPSLAKGMPDRLPSGEAVEDRTERPGISKDLRDATRTHKVADYSDGASGRPGQAVTACASSDVLSWGLRVSVPQPSTSSTTDQLRPTGGRSGFGPAAEPPALK